MLLQKKKKDRSKFPSLTSHETFPEIFRDFATSKLAVTLIKMNKGGKERDSKQARNVPDDGREPASAEQGDKTGLACCHQTDVSNFTLLKGRVGPQRGVQGSGNMQCSKETEHVNVQDE